MVTRVFSPFFRRKNKTRRRGKKRELEGNGKEIEHHLHVKKKKQGNSVVDFHLFILNSMLSHSFLEAIPFKTLSSLD